MSKATVEKAKRIIGRMKTVEEIGAVLNYAEYRRIAIKNKIRQQEEDEAFERIKSCAPGDTLIACKRSSFVSMGDVLEIIRIMPRLRKIQVRNGRRGIAHSMSMGDVVDADLRKDAPHEIMALALAQRLGVQEQKREVEDGTGHFGVFFR